MSRKLGTVFAGAGSAVLLTAAGAVSAQDIPSRDFTVEPPPANETISDQWRVRVNPENSLLSTPANLFPPGRFEDSRIYSLQRDVPISDNQTFSVRFDTQRGNEGGLANMIESRSLPFSGSNEPGEGSWGLKYKRRVVSVQWSVTW